MLDLAFVADLVDDLEATRIANENRLRHMTRDATDSDGGERGLGLDERDPAVATVAALVETLAGAEKTAVRLLEKEMKQHPLGPWVKAQKGIGLKQAARLLASVGDPYINEQTGQPRTVSQLWSYCGHGDASRKPKKGMTQAEAFALGSPVAKMRLYLIACSIIKQMDSPLRKVYDDRKAETEFRLHATECRRCGPSGHPAQPGSPWSDGHRHADALRIVGKEVLRGLWLEGKRLHETAEIVGDIAA